MKFPSFFRSLSLSLKCIEVTRRDRKTKELRSSARYNSHFISWQANALLSAATVKFHIRKCGTRHRPHGKRTKKIHWKWREKIGWKIKKKRNDEHVTNTGQVNSVCWALCKTTMSAWMWCVSRDRHPGWLDFHISLSGKTKRNGQFPHGIVGVETHARLRTHCTRSQHQNEMIFLRSQRLVCLFPPNKIPIRNGNKKAVAAPLPWAERRKKNEENSA